MDWFAGKEFTSNYAAGRVESWLPILEKFKNEKIEVLEIGSYEGSSAVFFARYLEKAHITCVDFFNGPFEKYFDKNVAEFGDRITKIKASGISVLDAMKNEKRVFPLIYLDGGKRRDHVLGMSLLAWQMLQTGGILIWDDYAWGKHEKPENRPHDGIDAFLALHPSEFHVLSRAGQMIVSKRRHPDRAKALLRAKAQAAAAQPA